MNKRSFCGWLFFIFFFSVSIAVSGEGNLSQTDLASAESVIRSHIDLINRLIQNPEAATMRNLKILGNPHDETEWIFFINSISDGTKSAFDKNSDKLEEHISLTSKSEKSILLQYLRLTLLAFNKRPGSSVPKIKIEKILEMPKEEFEFIAECKFTVYNISGQQMDLPMRIIFETDYEAFARKEIYLQQISIKNRIVYGWWYDIGK